jgi:hypothetical protein
VTLFSAAVELIFGQRLVSEWRADNWGLIAALVGALGLSIVAVIGKRFADP